MGSLDSDVLGAGSMILLGKNNWKLLTKTVCSLELFPLMSNSCTMHRKGRDKIRRYLGVEGKRKNGRERLVYAMRFIRNSTVKFGQLGSKI